jgi:phosphatidylinositol alpha-mannosyltransferase
VATFHFYLEEEKRPPLFDSVLSLVGSTVFSRLSRLIAVSEKAALPFQKHTKQHFEIIPNGVDLTRFNPNVCPVKKYKDGKLNVLFVGRLEERKGVDFLLKAWAKFKRNKHIRLIIVGEGPLREDLLTLAKKLGISNVVFTGLMDDKTLPSYYALADIFTAPAIFGESFGMVLLEAMASGKPIVAFDNPGYKGILAQQKKYCLASNRDVIDLAEKINNLIESPEKREELSEWGICEARKYSWDKIAKMVVQVYESVL